MTRAISSCTTSPATSAAPWPTCRPARSISRSAVEHRHQSAAFTPDPIVSAGLGADIPAQPASGHFNVNEIYGEVRIPVLKDMPFAYSLEFEWRGPLFALFDGRRQGDLYGQRPVEAGPRPAVPRRLLDRVPRSDASASCKGGRSRYRPSARRSVHQRRRAACSQTDATRPRELHRQRRSRRRQLCRSAGTASGHHPGQSRT